MNVERRHSIRTRLAAALVAAGCWLGAVAPAGAQKILPDNPLLPLGRVDNAVRAATNLASQAAASARAFTAGDVLQLLDGSTLHGHLKSLDPKGVVSWQHPFAVKPMEFVPAALYQIRFEQNRMITNDSKAACRFRFRNGDEVLGDLVSLDTKHVELNSWFAGKLQAPREALQSIAFLQKGFAVRYEGPVNADGWKIGPAADAWRYSDGSFIAGGVGFLGRGVDMPLMSRISFELRWTGQLNLMASFYTDALDRFDFGSNGYLLSVNSGYINLQRMQGGRGMVHLGQAQVQEMMTKNRAQLELRFNRERGLIVLLVDGVVAQEFRDATPAGAVDGKDDGITFYSQRAGASLRLSDIKIAEWDGRNEEPVLTNVTSNVVRLVNNDRVNGEVQSLRDGKLRIQLDGTQLDIPAQRITQIVLGGETTTNASPGNLIRADLNLGGRVSLELQDWSGQELKGRSTNFGLITLKPEWLRVVRFNPDRKPQGTDLDVDVDDPLTFEP